jgi:hypothetical protein
MYSTYIAAGEEYNRLARLGQRTGKSVYGVLSTETERERENLDTGQARRLTGLTGWAVCVLSGLRYMVLGTWYLVLVQSTSFASVSPSELLRYTGIIIYNTLLPTKHKVLYILQVRAVLYGVVSSVYALELMANFKANDD